jgi:outer membrane protein OmpA-like peptidoglycan-associated protein
MRLPRKRNDSETANFDLSISDLMSALVLIFILLLSTQLLEVKKQSNIAKQTKENQEKLYQELISTFQLDLERWNAEIDEKTLVVRFRDEDKVGSKTGFDPESAILKERFKNILDEFFPRYVKILMKPEYINNIDEVRIEGHTANPEGKYSTSKGYSDSIWLSQERANNVLFYILQSNMLTEVQGSATTIEWVRTHIAASGFAYAKPIMMDLEKKIPDWNQSRRVEFRIRTKYEDVIQQMIDIGKNS